MLTAVNRSDDFHQRRVNAEAYCGKAYCLPCGYSAHRGAGFDVVRHHSACGYDGCFANVNTLNNRCPGTYVGQVINCY